MSENIYNIFSDLIEVPEIITCAWRSTEDEIIWNTESNLADLYEYCGETYSGEIYGSTDEREGYIFATIWDGCGQHEQIILQKDKRVEFTDELVASLYAEEGEEV